VRLFSFRSIDIIPDHTTDAAQGWYFNTRPPSRIAGKS
jgi:hypothetical protein